VSRTPTENPEVNAMAAGNVGGPTALRMLLGAHLRRLRETEGITRASAGYHIRASESKISRMELGRVSFKVRDVEDLLKLYGVDDPEEIDRLLQLAADANSPGWWHRYGAVLPDWFQSYLGLESAASRIRTYEVQFIPGLLQTRDYARSVVELAYGKVGKKEIDHRVELRSSRQKLLVKPGAPRLWAVIDEAVLRRPMGSHRVMREQLEELITYSHLPNVVIQILRFNTGGHAAAGGGFSILRFPDPELSDIVYLEHLTSALYLDKPEDLDAYTTAMDRTCVQAKEPRETEEILREIIERDYT
jgi:hypothetical protein